MHQATTTAPDAEVLPRLEGQILILTLANSPVNALSNAMRRSLRARLESALGDPGVRAVVLHGEGRCFSAGAEIREFGRPRQMPYTGDIANVMEAAPKPIVCALHGTTLGGGLELAMGAHYRICAPGATFGLPEVRIGLLPGGGGTQRLPRLVGAANALHLMLTGDHIDSRRALEIGLVDEIMQGGDLVAAAVARAAALAEATTLLRRSGQGTRLADQKASLEEVESAMRAHASRAKGLIAPRLIGDAVRHAINSPFDEGLQFESNAFQQCMESPQRQALIHMFLAERQAARSPVAAPAREIRKTGVIGGGTMGSGISVALLNAGYSVRMVETSATAAQTGVSRVQAIYDKQVRAGRMEATVRDALLERFVATSDYADLADVDLVVEAVFEEMDVKKSIFTRLDGICRPGAIFATNTSYLDIDEIASCTSRPQDVIGLHFFSPAHVMKLLEIVVAHHTADDVVATCFELARSLKKVPVKAGVCDGFIGNRILYACREVASYLMEDGATPYEIDAALEEFGFPMGPFRMADLAGGDIGWSTRKRKAATRDPQARYVRIGDLLCERGWFGQKTGRGYYLYSKESRGAAQDPQVLALIDEERQQRGIAPRTFGAQEIVDRYLAAMIQEAARILEDGVAARPSDIDVVMVHGYGFPRWRGGPMLYADGLGLSEMALRLRLYSQEDAYFWRPSPLLAMLAERGASFGSLNGW